MLQLDLNISLVNASQAYYRRLDTIGEFRRNEICRNIMALRRMHHANIKRFNEYQQKYSNLKLDFGVQNGRIETLRTAIPIPFVYNPNTPPRGAAILHGLQLPQAGILPNSPCQENGVSLKILDPNTYLAVLNQGPPNEDEFPDLASLVVYMDLVNVMMIVWIGLRTDLLEAQEIFAIQTQNWHDWSGIYARYHARLREACITAA